MFEEFKNLYSLTKTITFNLNPTEITQKNMEENNHMLLRELELNNKEYLIHDAFDKIFTSNNNNVSNDLFVDRLNTLSYSYRYFKNNKDLKKEYDKLKKDIVKFIADQFRNEDGNKLLFSKDTIKVIKDAELVENDLISMFNKSRIKSFVKTRKTAIDNIAKRIVSNIELMTDNIVLLNKIISDNYDIDNEIVDTINNINICLYKQEAINKYNDVIAVINQKLNEDYQKNILSKKYKFIQLQKTILSGLKSNFTFEQYKSVEDVRNAFVKLFEIYTIDNIYNKLSDIFINCDNYNFANIVIKNNKLHDFSAFVYGNHNFIVNKINKYANKNIALSKQEKFKKSDFTIEQLNNIVGENIFTKIKIDTETYKDLFAKFCFCPIDSKEYFEHCLNFCTNVKDTFGDVVKIFDFNSTDIDAIFNSNMEEVYDFYKDFNKVFNCTRNFASKKNDYVKSYIINWDNSTFGEGWAETKIKEYRNCIFVKNNKYYFGYFIDNRFELEKTEDKNNSYAKMVYMQNKPLKITVGKCIFTTNEVKNHFDNSNESMIFNSNSCTDLTITKAIYDIYKNKTYKNNNNDKNKFINFLIDFYRNKYVNGKYFDFSNLKTAEEYETFEEFEKDIDTRTFSISFEYITDECIDRLQKENKLWLFQLYCQDFSEYKKANSSKNIHTLIFESFFSEENKLKQFPIRLNGGFEIRYRDAGLTDGFVHKKWSILLNKNDKNGNRIPDSIYCKLFAYVNGKDIELTVDDKYYIENELLITKIAQYDIIKDRRYIAPKYEIHLPFTLNSTADNNSDSILNNKIDEYVKSNKCNIIGIDRGERNLLCVTVINHNGEVLERCCLDKINNVNYNELMTVIEKDRQNQRRNWKEVSQIKNVKKGFVSYAVKAIVDLVEKYNAIICLEGLNDGFMQSRTKIEKSIYREFVKQLINKLAYMVVDKKQSIIDVKQLAFPNCTDKFHNGIIYYVDPSYTSKIDCETGFANLFNFSKITNNETRKKFFEKFDDIKFEDNLYKFEFDYKNFDTYKNYLNNKKFIACSYGDRIKRFKNSEGYWDSKKIELTKELNNVFENIDVSNCVLKDVILNDDKICSQVFELFKLIVQLRNTDKNNDYLVSPIKKGLSFYDTTKTYYGYCCEDEQSLIQCNPDMEASYNIAIKAMLKVYHNKLKNEDYFEYFCSR